MGISGNQSCTNTAKSNNEYTDFFTPAWKDTNNTYTYGFNGVYLSLDALNDGNNPYTQHKVQSDLYHRTTLTINDWLSNYEEYGS